MIIYRASYSENIPVEIDAVGDFYAASRGEVVQWARTQLTGAGDGDEVEIEKIEVADLSPRKLALACLNQSRWVHARELFALYKCEKGRTVLVRLGSEEKSES